MEKIILYYKEILGIDLANLSHPISKKINSLTSLSDKDRKINEHHLRTLALALFDIKEYSEEIYKTYLKRIVKNSDISIHGHIFEIKQCAHFIETSKRENLDFKFGDADKKEPDFFVNNSGFEITSIRFAESTTDINPGNKLLDKFWNKNGKDYAHNNTALLINISEATFQTFQSGKLVNQSLDDVRKIIKSRTKFGIVLCFLELIELIDGNIHFKGTVYPEYSDDCCPELKDLIENKFIKGQKNEFGKDTFIGSN